MEKREKKDVYSSIIVHTLRSKILLCVRDAKKPNSFLTLNIKIYVFCQVRSDSTDAHYYMWHRITMERPWDCKKVYQKNL